MLNCIPANIFIVSIDASTPHHHPSKLPLQKITPIFLAKSPLFNLQTAHLPPHY